MDVHQYNETLANYEDVEKQNAFVSAYYEKKCMQSCSEFSATKCSHSYSVDVMYV